MLDEPKAAAGDPRLHHLRLECGADRRQGDRADRAAARPGAAPGPADRRPADPGRGQQGQTQVRRSQQNRGASDRLCSGRCGADADSMCRRDAGSVPDGDSYEAARSSQRRRRACERRRGESRSRASRSTARAVKPGDPVRCAARQQDRRRAFRRRRRSLPARSRSPADQHAPIGGRRAACVTPTMPRRALAQAAARFYPRQPAHDRRGHRHQRQDLDRRLHAPDSGRGLVTGREPRHPRHRLAEARPSTAPDHARSDRAARILDETRRRRRHASRAWRRRPTGSTSTASTACGSTAAAFTNLSPRPPRLSSDVGAYFAAKLRLFSDLRRAGRHRGDRRRS